MMILLVNDGLYLGKCEAEQSEGSDPEMRTGGRWQHSSMICKLHVLRNTLQWTPIP